MTMESTSSQFCTMNRGHYVGIVESDFPHAEPRNSLILQTPMEVEDTQHFFQDWAPTLPKGVSLRESKTEMWENEKTEADMEEYTWENSPSQKNVLDTLLQIRAAENTEVTREELLASEIVENYKTSVVALKNEGETENNILKYKESVLKLLNLQALQ